MNEEYYKLVLGLDAGQVVAGSQKILADQQQLALRVGVLWKAASAQVEGDMAKRVVMEKATMQKIAVMEAERVAEHLRAQEVMIQQERDANTVSIALARGRRDAVMLADREALRNRAANGNIIGNAPSAGGMAGMAGAQIAGDIAGGGGAGEVGRDAAGMAVMGAGWFAGSAIGSRLMQSNALREVMVLIREALRGNFTRMAGSFSLLLQYMGVSMATLASYIPIIGTAAAAGYGMIRAARGMEDNTGEVDAKTKTAARLRKDIEALVKARIATPEQAEVWNQTLSNGSTSGIRAVQRDIAPLIPINLKNLLARAEAQPELDRMAEQDHLRKVYASREGLSGKPLLDADFGIIRDILKRKIGSIKNQDSAEGMIEQAKLQLELDAASAQYAKDKLAMIKEGVSIQKDLVKLEREKSHTMDADYMPTVGQLAGAGGWVGWTQRRINMLKRDAVNAKLKGNYGRAQGDIDEIEGVDVPMANLTPWQLAQNARQEALNNAQHWSHALPFDPGGYHIGGLKDRLRDAGLELQNDHLKNINEAISDLNKRAATSGIKIADTDQ